MCRAAVVREKSALFISRTSRCEGPRGRRKCWCVLSCGNVPHGSRGSRPNFPTPLPAVLGHEGSGSWFRQDPAVTKVRPGSCGPKLCEFAGFAQLSYGVAWLLFPISMRTICGCPKADGSSPCHGRTESGQRLFSLPSPVAARSAHRDRA